MNILFGKDKYDVTKVMNNFVKLINEINGVKKDDLFCKLKLFYYTKIKYPMFRRYIHKLIMKNATIVYDNPEMLIPVTIAFVFYIIRYCKYTSTDFNRLMDKLFPDGNNKVLFYYNANNSKLLEKIIIIARYSEKNKNRFIQTKYRIRLDEYECDLEQTVYDCTTYEESRMADILYHKIFMINKNGELSNPNYILDSSLKKEDYEKYRVMALIITNILFRILNNTTQLQFIKVK